MENSASNDGLREPLLHSFQDENGLPAVERNHGDELQAAEKRSAIQSAAQLLLLALMWALLVVWIALLVLLPTRFFRHSVQPQLSKITSSPFCRIIGNYFFLFSVPIFLIAILGTIYLQIRPGIISRAKGFTHPKVLLSTNPALVNGLLGVVSVAELMFMAVFLLYMVWVFWSYLSQDFSAIRQLGFLSLAQRWRFKLALVGLRSGIMGLIYLGFLFLPVSRGSVLLRLIDIPFEHAVKYHVWLGHLMMAIFTVHGLAFVVVWASEGRLISELVSWTNVGVANLPGVIALIAGWAMWVTSLYPVRQHFFELFFYTHQLYAIFLIFMALHAGDFLLGIGIAGVFFFLIDRFLRFCQSRRAVTVLSARTLPCSTIELVLAKPPNLKYHALSFIFLNIPGFSWLQWHPFSVSSSPYDSDSHLAILIKPLGSWTHELKAAVSATEQQCQRKDGCPFKMRVGAEGPYGHESNYYLRYNNLILVAGGIGVSPFVAILRDIFHRCQKHEIGLPQNVLLIWAVKKSKELCILDLVNPASICSDYSERINFDVQAYVTQESEANLEVGQENFVSETTMDASLSSTPMSVVVGTGSNFWFCLCLLVCVICYTVIAGVFGKYLVNPFDEGSDSATSLWLRGGYVALSMIMAVIIFGGIIVALWNLCNGRLIQSIIYGPQNILEEKRPLLYSRKQDSSSDEPGIARLLQPHNTHYGIRPNFAEIFEDAAKQWEGSNVGVLVCGPQSIQTSVAIQCRNCNYMSLMGRKVAFHYHSVSFDL